MNAIYVAEPSGSLPRYLREVTPGANPTIVSYNASAIKSNNATNSPVRFFIFFVL
jgi:hypothetical protein